MTCCRGQAQNDRRFVGFHLPLIRHQMCNLYLHYGALLITTYCIMNLPHFSIDIEGLIIQWSKMSGRARIYIWLCTKLFTMEMSCLYNSDKPLTTKNLILENNDLLKLE